MRFRIRMSRIAEGDAETACPLTCEPPRPDPAHRSGIRLGLSQQGFDWRQIGVRIAVGEVAKGRKQVARRA
jgi:hypothetical protein